MSVSGIIGRRWVYKVWKVAGLVGGNVDGEIEEYEFRQVA
jgi:hypothetical protein